MDSQIKVIIRKIFDGVALTEQEKETYKFFYRPVNPSPKQVVH